MKKYVIPAIALLALAAFGLAACGDDDNTSTKTSTVASNATAATNSGNGQSGDKSNGGKSATAAATDKATQQATQDATKDPGSGQITGSGADALKKLATDISKKTYSVSYEMSVTDSDGKTTKGTMSFIQKPPKTATAIEQTEGGDASSPGSILMIDDGKNTYTCFKDPSSGAGQCMKAASVNSGDTANFGFSLDDTLKNLSEDLDVTDAGSQKIAGQDSHCFKVKTSDGDGTACFSKKDGIATLYDGGSSDNSKITLKATNVSTSVDDSAFEVPKDFQVVDPSNPGGG